MNNFSKLVKENKKRALSLAIATAFVIANPLGLTGCTSNYDPYKEEEEDEDGSFHSSWHSIKNSSEKKSGGKSSYKSKSSSSNSKSSGYSSSRGGKSSS